MVAFLASGNDLCFELRREVDPMTRSTEQVYQDHLRALHDGDLLALMADYADDAILMTMVGASPGKAAIQAWFVEMLTSMPNVNIVPGEYTVHGEIVMATWSAVSDVATVPQGVDTFVIHDDRIWLQTIWYTIVPK